MTIARRALATFDELAHLEQPTAIERDAAIQRFEYTQEAVWKAAQRYLDRVEGVNAESPRAVVRASARAGLLTAEQGQHALAMLDDRNLTAHTYNEQLAIALFARLGGYATLLNDWLNGLERNLG